MHHPLILSVILGLTSLLAQVSGQDSENEFMVPPPPSPTPDLSSNIDWRTGETMTMKWSTTWDTIRLGIYQGVRDPEKEFPTVHWWRSDFELSSNNEYDWDVTLDLPDTEPPAFFDLARGEYFGLVVYDGSGSGEYFNSHAFNISYGDGYYSSSTSSAASSSSMAPYPSSSVIRNVYNVATTSISSSSAGATITKQAQPPLTTTPTAIPDSSGGLSQTTKIGLGAGLGLGLGCALLGIGAFFLFRRRQRRHSSEKSDFYQSPASERTGDLQYIEEQSIRKT